MLADLGTITLHPLQPIRSPFEAQPITWTATAPVLLQGAYTYRFGLNDATLPVGAKTLAGYRLSSDGAMHWNTSTFCNAMQITVRPAPVSAVLALLRRLTMQALGRPGFLPMARFLILAGIVASPKRRLCG